MNQLSARHIEGYFGEHTGSLGDHCEAANAMPPVHNIKVKIKRAIESAVDDGCIHVTGSNEYAFSIDGEGQFIDHLISICTLNEKHDFLYDYVLDNADDKVVAEVCDYLMGNHNALDSITKDAALKIINSRDFSQSVTDALAARGLPF